MLLNIAIIPALVTPSHYHRPKVYLRRTEWMFSILVSPGMWHSCTETWEQSLSLYGQQYYLALVIDD